MRRLILMLALMTAGAVIVGACGDDDDSGGDTSEPTTTAVDSTDSAPPDTEASTDDDGATASGGEVPDPCTLLSSEELSSLLGGDQGTGTVQATDPDQRKVCTYDSGLFLSVELGANYEASVQAIRDSGAGTVQDVSGVGEEAIWQDIGGGVGQVVALGDEYMVGVTLGTGGQSVGEAVAQAMLAAL